MSRIDKAFAIERLRRVMSRAIQAVKRMKTIEAFLRGYVVFNVNGRTFWRYSSALAARKATSGPVHFKGLHVLKGWRTFFLRIGGES